MYPVAWAVVERENEETWTWFFQILFEELRIDDGFGWTFTSDQQKGLINAIKKLSPQAEHRNCARHIYANWKKKFAGPKFKRIFWEIAKSTLENQFHSKLQELKDEDVSAYEAFCHKNPKVFCRALISIWTKSNSIDNNICETFNSYILKSRAKPLIDMLEDIRLKLMGRMHEIVKGTQLWTDVICPSVRKKLLKTQKLVKYCGIKPAVGGKYEIKFFEESYIVDLVSRTCTCKSWMLTGLPCCHALSCIFYMRDDPVNYVDPFFSKRNYIAAYEHALSPINGKRDWPEVDAPPILPPVFVKPPGRPKKNRKKDSHEESKTKKKAKTGKYVVPRIGTKIQCSSCGQLNHNKKTCPNPGSSQAANRPNPKGKNGNPKKDGESEKKKKKKVVDDQPRMRQPSRLVDEEVANELRENYMGSEGMILADSGRVYYRIPDKSRPRMVSGPIAVAAAIAASNGIRRNAHEVEDDSSQRSNVF